MTVHVHAWTPIPLESGRYECVCTATGYRKDGEIVLHKQPLRRPTAVTVRSQFTHDGAIPPKPTSSRER